MTDGFAILLFCISSNSEPKELPVRIGGLGGDLDILIGLYLEGELYPGSRLAGVVSISSLSLGLKLRVSKLQDEDFEGDLDAFLGLLLGEVCIDIVLFKRGLFPKP
jgi:hypothetical protein